MQLLSDATERADRAAPAPARVAGAVLDAVPAVMWFVRRHMRCRRTRGLSVPQFRTLVLINRFPGASLSLIAEHLGSSMPTASRLVAGMVTRGLLTRRDCPDDRRQVKLALTARGQSAHDAALEGTRSAVAEKLAALTSDERAGVVAAMESLSKIFAAVAPE